MVEIMVEEKNTETEIAILKKDLDVLVNLSDKFDQAIDRLQTIANSVDKMLVIHEMRLENQEKQSDYINSNFLEFKKEIIEEIQDLRKENKDQHDKVDKRLSNLETWRWYVVGVATAAGIVLTYFANHFFK